LSLPEEKLSGLSAVVVGHLQMFDDELRFEVDRAQ